MRRAGLFGTSPCDRTPVLRTVFVFVFVLAGLAAPAHSQIVADVVDLGANGEGVVVHPTSGRFYVAVPNGIQVYDVATLVRITTIALPAHYSASYDLAIHAGANRLYAVGLNGTHVIDLASNAVLASLDVKGMEVSLNETTNRVYVAAYVPYPYSDPYAVRVLDGATNTWLPDIILGAPGASKTVHLAADAGTNRIYITYTGDNDLRVLDGATHAELGRVNLPAIGSVAVDPSTGRAYVNRDYDDVAVIEGTPPVQTALIADAGQDLHLNPVTRRLFGLVSRTPGSVVRFADMDANRVTGYLYLDGGLNDLGVHPQLGRLYGSHHAGAETWRNRLSVIQDVSPAGPPPPAALPAVIAAIDLPEDGRGVAVNNVTGRLYVGVAGGVAVYNAASLAPEGFVDLASGSYLPPIYDVVVDEQRNRIYAAGLSETWAISGVNSQVAGSVTGGDELAVNPANGRLYIGDHSSYQGVPDRLRIYDGLTLASIRTVDLGTSIYYQSVHVAVNPTIGYAYCTYSLDGKLRIVSPATDGIVQTIEYAEAGLIAVNPATNRVYVDVEKAGQEGTVVLDGVTHAELGFFEDVGGLLAVNPLTGRLYSTSSSTLFRSADAGTGAVLGRVFIDGGVRDVAVGHHLERLYVTHSGSPAIWEKKLYVIQDTQTLPPPPPPPDLVPTYLPLVLRS